MPTDAPPIESRSAVPAELTVPSLNVAPEKESSNVKLDGVMRFSRSSNNRRVRFRFFSDGGRLRVWMGCRLHSLVHSFANMVRSPVEGYGVVPCHAGVKDSVPVLCPEILFLVQWRIEGPWAGPFVTVNGPDPKSAAPCEKVKKENKG